jgi:two-component system, OmpR family, sensor histidine kinase MprB
MTALVSRMGRISFRTRLGALTAAAVLVTVALSSLVSFLVVHHQLYSQVDSTLQRELTAMSPGGNFRADVANNLLGRYNGSLVQVNAQNGDVVYPGPFDGLPGLMQAPLPFGASEAALAGSSSGDVQYRSVTYQGQPYRVLAVGAVDHPTGAPEVIQIAQPLAAINHTLHDLRLILWLVTIGGAALAVVLGWLIGRATMRPVVRLTGAAEHVAATQDLASTIQEDGDDELARLARAFNSMLQAVAASRQQQAQLISDAGHELRTPLTSLRTNIEVLMKVPDLPGKDREELVADINAQLEEMTTLIGDLVDLAREDEKHSEPIEVRLDSIVAHAVDRARRRAPGVTFETELTPGSVRAQPAMLERAVLNVLDNAAKWSPPGGKVTVRLVRADRWTLDVKDEGPGISAADLPHVFDRFYRAESARSMPGSGLGLAIVRQVVMSHGGWVSASTPPGQGGTLVHIELPIVYEQELSEQPPSPPPSPWNGPSPWAGVAGNGLGERPAWPMAPAGPGGQAGGAEPAGQVDPTQPAEPAGPAESAGTRASTGPGSGPPAGGWS